MSAVGWAVGDLAECLDNSPSPQEARADRLEVGSIYRVARLGVPEGSRSGITCLAFREITVPGNPKKGDAFVHTRFRKVLPPAAEPCEEEFTQLVNRTRREVRA